MIGTRFSWSYRCQLVEACKELVEGHDQLLRRALGRQAGEALDVGEQDAAETQKTHTKNTTSERLIASRRTLTSCLGSVKVS